MYLWSCHSSPHEEPSWCWRGLRGCTGHCGRLVLSKGLQHCCGIPLESAAEEDVQALVKKHKITPQGQAVILCQPAKLFWEDLVLFQYCLLGETHLQKRRRMAKMPSPALPCDLLCVRGWVCILSCIWFSLCYSCT